MVKHIFLYGILINTINRDDCCSIRSARVPGTKLAIDENKNIPTLFVTWDIVRDYVLGDVIKICNDKKFMELVQQLDTVAVGFKRKVIQVIIKGKKKPVDAYAYFANDMQNYKEIDNHSYGEWCDAQYEIIEKPLT